MTTHDPSKGSESGPAEVLTRRSVLKAGAMAASALAVPAAVTTPAAGAPAQTDDDLRVDAGGGSGISLDAEGRVIGLSTTDRQVELATLNGGLFVRHPVSGSQHPVVGHLVRSGSSLVLRADVPALQVSVEASYRRISAGAVQVSGAVVDQTGADRVLDTVFELPLGISSGTLESNLVGAQIFDAGAQPVPTDSFPMATVSDADRAFTLAYAIPPDQPSRFRIGIEPREFELEQEVAWEFEENGNAEGWVPTGAEPQLTPFVVADGLLSTSSTGVTPLMHQTQPLSVDASSGAVVEIVMQTSTSSGAWVNWATADDPSFRRVDFAVAEGAMQTYRVDIPPEESELTRLRIVPLRAEGDIRIDAIRVHKKVLGPTERTFFIRQLWGLSPAATGPLHSRAPFTFTLDLGVDTAWGYRSALQRYYDRAPEWFGNLAGELDYYGIQQVVPRSYYERPSSIGFHSAGRGKDTKELKATTLDEYAANDEWAADDANGVATLPYTIPGQREIIDLPALPATYEEAIAAFESWDHDPVIFGAPNSPSSFDSAEQLKEMINHSALHNPSGRFVLNIRNTPWGGNSVTFPVNPNPRLYADQDKLTIAKYLLDYYIPWMLTNQYVDGVITDSLFGWGRYYNYRREHFAAATIPLTYTEITNVFGTAFVPGLYNDFSQLEFVWKLRSMFHSRGKVLYMNGLRLIDNDPRAFDGFANDIMATEGRFTNFVTGERQSAFSRAVARHKIVSLQVNQEWSDESLVATLWKFALLYGLAPQSANIDHFDFNSPGPIDSDTRMTALEIKYQDLYMEVLRELLRVGWEPLTGVQPSSESVRVERYGDRKDDFYLVIYNIGEEQTVSFTVDNGILPAIRGLRVLDVLNDNAPASDDLAQAVIGRGNVTLPAQANAVLHFTK